VDELRQSQTAKVEVSGLGDLDVVNQLLQTSSIPANRVGSEHGDNRAALPEADV
jgi:hypothetical protein